MAKRQKIPVTTDLSILQDLAANYTCREIAIKHGVSPSYVSKIKSGKKNLNIHVSNPTVIKDEFFEVYNSDLIDLIGYLEDKDLIVEKKDIVEYLEVQMKKSIIRAKMFQEILRRYTRK